MLAQIAGTLLSNAPLFLIPFLHLERGLTLVEAGILASTPLVATTLTLIMWGAVVDRIGERLSLTIGLAIVTVGGLGAALSTSYVGLGLSWLLAGVGAASTNSASGRLVVGWFPRRATGHRDGDPADGAAARHRAGRVHRAGHRGGAGAAAGTAHPDGGVCGGDDHRRRARRRPAASEPRGGRRASGQLANPYRGSSRLGRIHVASMLLVIPQITVWTYMLVWLIDDRQWSTTAAGALVGLHPAAGCGGAHRGRLVVGPRGQPPRPDAHRGGERLSSRWSPSGCSRKPASRSRS